MCLHISHFIDYHSILVSLSRGQEISLKDEKISELETRVTDQLKQISSIEKEWKEAKIKLTKDATVKRLSNENNDMKSKYFWCHISFLIVIKKLKKEKNYWCRIYFYWSIKINVKIDSIKFYYKLENKLGQ